MAANKRLKSDSRDFLTADSETVEKALEKSIRHALLKHIRANNPVAVWRDGKVVLLSPDEILIDNPQNTKIKS